MFHFILADLVRNRIGVVVLIILVALATALGVTITLQERAMRLGSARAAAPFDLVIGAPGSETQLVLSSVFLQPAPLPLVSPEVLAGLRADPRVEAAVPVGFGDFVESNPIIGTTADAVAMFGGLTEGTAFDHLGDAVAGAEVKRAVGSTFRPFHGNAGDVGEVHAEVQYRIVGRLARTGTPWDRAILVPIQAVWDTHAAHHHDADEAAAHQHGHEDDFAARPVDNAVLDGDANPGVPAIVIKPKSISDAYNLRQQYRGDTTLAVFPGEVLTRLYGTLGDARRVLSLVATGAQALVAAAILMVIATHVLQRRRQIGALRAFGAPRAVVLSLVWLETFALLAVGLLTGFAIGYAATHALSQRLGEASGVAMPVELNVSDAWMLAAFLIAAALVTFLPALIAYRQTPAQALRS